MQISVIDVGTPNTHAGAGGRSYQSLEVTYKSDDGKVASKKLMSFVYPKVFSAAKTWSKGDVVNIKTEKVPNKDGQSFWQWTDILGEGEEVEVASKPASSGASTGTRVTGSNYETKEERAARQVMIVRQSSLSTSVAALTVGSKAAPSAQDVINYARDLEAYVLGTAVDTDTFIGDIEDDIPV